jgi:hypothetical protein
MFSISEQKAIKEKLNQLRRIKQGTLTPLELSELITKRRVNWMGKNQQTLRNDRSLNIDELAYNIIFFDHMNINPEFSRIKRISPNKIQICSYNFCPYLEACGILGLDTRIICKEIGEPSIQKMISLINPNLKFSRDYNHIRPYTPFCKEYIEIKK